MEEPSLTSTAMEEVNGNAAHKMEPCIQDQQARVEEADARQFEKSVTFNASTAAALREEVKADTYSDDKQEESADTIGGFKFEKKKKKKKSGKSKSKPKPTGFEEYYVDAPITPEEYQEERSLYDPTWPFTHRIQTAIQRYSAKRRFDSRRKELFDKYLTYGGVDSGPKMFGGGMDVDTLESSNTREIAALGAHNFVSEDKEPSPESHYVVDFDGVLKGFLSSRLPQAFDLSARDTIVSHVAVIRNFLNYLLHHDVCPEYAAQIQSARRTCDAAEHQLWACQLAGSLLPGGWNVACSTLFGGYYCGMHREAEAGRKSEPDRHSESVGLGMARPKADRVFKAGFAAYGQDKQHDTYNTQVRAGTLRIMGTYDVALEVLELRKADEEVRGMYAHPSMRGLAVLGVMRVRKWINPSDAEEDLSAEERMRVPSAEGREEVYDLWVEESVLDVCFVGMKFQGVMREMSFGVRFLDMVGAAHCAFFDVLPNEDMLGWKKHVYLEPRMGQGGEWDGAIQLISEGGEGELAQEDEAV